MSPPVFDASALLCFLQGERGADVVEQALEEGGCCPAPNWAEVAQRVRARAADWSLARQLLLSYDLVVEEVGMVDAEHAAAAWQRRSGLSLADRLCLAVTERLDAEVWTADQAWGTSGRVRQIR